MFGNLFSGMNVSNMNVHFNIGNGNGLPQLNPYTSGNQLGHSSNAMLIENKSDKMLYKFNNSGITSSYKLAIFDEYDSDTRPKGEFDTLNPRYIISEFPGQHGYKHIPNIISEIINRKDKLPPIVTLLDYEQEEDKTVIDQILFNVYLLVKHYKHEKFFLVLETSGEAEAGEPFFVTFSKVKGLFKKEIYSISI